ncbi:MAG: type II toxin-antitoxin system Phd/YefM family antitoxin [Parvularculaceae bacterium]
MNPRSKIWPLQEAKARFSELVRLAQTEGPQTVTVRGKPAVTIVPIAEPALSGLSGLDVYKSLWKGPAFDFDIPDWETEGDFRDIDLG